MVTSERTRRRTAGTVVGGGLALALALTGCGSESDPARGSGSVGRPDAGTSAPASAATTSADPAPSTSASSVGATPVADRSSSSRPASPTAPLSPLLLRKSDLPDTYDQGGPPEFNGALLNESLRTCTGVGSPSDDTIVNSRTSPSYGFAGSGAVSTVTRYETQAAADADATLLTAPKAEQCFRSVLVKQFHTSGATTSAITTTVRPGSNNGPDNEVGIARVSFVEDQGREGRPTIRVAVYYLTGPRTLSTLVLSGHGNPFDQALSTKLLSTLAERTAAA